MLNIHLELLDFNIKVILQYFSFNVEYFACHLINILRENTRAVRLIKGK